MELRKEVYHTGPVRSSIYLTSTSIAIIIRCRNERTISRNILLTGEKPLIILEILPLVLPVRRINMNEKESDGRENWPPRIQQTLTLKMKLKVLKRYEH